MMKMQEGDEVYYTCLGDLSDKSNLPTPNNLPSKSSSILMSYLIHFYYPHKPTRFLTKTLQATNQLHPAKRKGTSSISIIALITSYFDIYTANLTLAPLSLESDDNLAI